ncbi:hypothetical protein NEOLI_000605 [Neolecta irregularis DAH-3]|uniref:Membrane protein PTM1 n=1 Tax=Neolecta irregularis (strain DAH-3) TaxID=1198029 RepID=A0A1U7LRK6_NEOID|nr:hypothetical protein NEOLI_000605 [Neolecta irregularis DAH-3]|eukprot:OLL25151.1 hypothetical protein NEOLI_000605 [Neolecta irregularis DAH-3]
MSRETPKSIMLALLLVLLCQISLVFGYEQYISESFSQRQRCAGMYSRKDAGGTMDPFIEVVILPSLSEMTSIVSLVIFEFKDLNRLGKAPEGRKELSYLCDTLAIEDKLCVDDQYGRYLVNLDKSNKTSIVTVAIDLMDPIPVKYPIYSTGYYCVGTEPFMNVELYEGIVVWRNSYGELPAAELPRLAFYGALTIAYALLGVFYGFLYFRHRDDILPLQNYISAMIAFLAIEMTFIWGYYHNVDRYDESDLHSLSCLGCNYECLSKFLLTLSSFNRELFYETLTDIHVSMGYSIVKPSLGGEMKRIRLLAGAHFILGTMYAILTMLTSPEDGGFLVLLVILPLAATMTAFYSWTLSSLTGTIKYLAERKQHQKGLLYRRIWRLLICILFARRDEIDFIVTFWKSRWFFLDGWLNVIYYAVFATIVFWLRPTANNKRFAMSQELAQEDGDFEIAEFESDVESNIDTTPRVSSVPPHDRPPHEEHNQQIFDIGDEDSEPRTSLDRPSREFEKGEQTGLK